MLEFIDDEFSTNKNVDISKLEKIPEYWERLTEDDQKRYIAMHMTLSSSNCKNKRFKSNQTFKFILETIMAYILRGDMQDYNRSLVCGLFYINKMKANLGPMDKEIILTNTNQLKILLKRSKSSINDSLKCLGYVSIQVDDKECIAGEDISGMSQPSIVAKIIPEFQNMYHKTRQWIVRQRSADWVMQPFCRQRKKNEDHDFVTPPPDPTPSIFPTVTAHFLLTGMDMNFDKTVPDVKEKEADESKDEQASQGSSQFEDDDISNIGYMTFDEVSDEELEAVF
jgi:hypothetical protein